MLFEAFDYNIGGSLVFTWKIKYFECIMNTFIFIAYWFICVNDNAHSVFEREGIAETVCSSPNNDWHWLCDCSICCWVFLENNHLQNCQTILSKNTVKVIMFNSHKDLGLTQKEDYFAQNQHFHIHFILVHLYIDNCVNANSNSVLKSEVTAETVCTSTNNDWPCF